MGYVQSGKNIKVLRGSATIDHREWKTGEIIRPAGWRRKASRCQQACRTDKVVGA